MASFRGSVKKADNSQATLRGKPEHCSIDPERLASIGLVPGCQVRIRRSSKQFGLYTVSETRPESSDSVVRMILKARDRLGTTNEFKATVQTQVPNLTLSDSEAEECSEFVERLADDGRQKALVVLAPHGGMIEPQTDLQSERFAAALGGADVSVWQCKGWNKGGGASKRWHITSTDIHELSFPLLKTIMTRGFVHAVSFHGFTKSNVLIGGAAPMKLKRDIKKELDKALVGSGISVSVAQRADQNNGDSKENLVNRITAGGANGVQIEQSAKARSGFWKEIADAVAAVYRRRFPDRRERSEGSRRRK